MDYLDRATTHLSNLLQLDPSEVTVIYHGGSGHYVASVLSDGLRYHGMNVTPVLAMAELLSILSPGYQDAETITSPTS